MAKGTPAFTTADWDDLLAAMEHFVWLDNCGALSREEAPHIETFQRILEQHRDS
jgi:hypothetical protein